MDMYIVIYFIFDNMFLINNYLAKHMQKHIQMDHKCCNAVFCPLAFGRESYCGCENTKLLYRVCPDTPVCLGIMGLGYIFMFPYFSDGYEAHRLLALVGGGL